MDRARRRISRPLSNASLLSNATRRSDLSMSEKRRSALIHYEADETFCSSVLRAEEVLRQSQRTRNEDAQRERHDRRRDESRYIYEHDYAHDPAVRKMRSLPFRQVARDRQDDLTMKSHDDEPHVHFRRNATQSLLPRHSAPLLARTPGRVTLQPPDEPTSKFSFSSAESKVGSLRSKAIRVSQSLLSKAPSHLSLRRRGSQNNLLEGADSPGERRNSDRSQGTSPNAKLIKGTIKRMRQRAHDRQTSGSSSHTKSDSVDSSVFTTSSSSKHGSHLSTTSTTSSKKSWISKLGRFVSRKRSSIREEDEQESSDRTSLQIRGPLNVAPLPERVRPPSRIPISAVFAQAQPRHSQLATDNRTSFTYHGSSDDNTTAAFASPTAKLAEPFVHDSMQPLLPAIPLRAKPHMTNTSQTRKRSFQPPSPARFRDLIATAPACSSPEKTASGLPLPHTPPRSSCDGSSAGEPSPKKRALGPEQVIGMQDRWHFDQVERSDWIVEQKKATTDLAALLSGLEETEDVSRRVDGANEVQREMITHQESIESIKSVVSDVPQDLHQLISAVSDHISEYSTEAIDQYGQRVTFERKDDTDSSTSDDSEEEEGEPHLSLQEYARQQHLMHATGATLAVSPGGTSLTSRSPQSSLPDSPAQVRGTPTVDSFAGVATDAVSAAAALRRILESDDTGEVEHQTIGRHGNRDSMRSLLEMGRPTLGEKMLDQVDFAVSLASLVPDLSPAAPSTHPSDMPVSVRREVHQDLTSSSSEGWSQVGRDSPVPLPIHLPRGSMARYSQIVAGPMLPAPSETTLDSVAASASGAQALAGPKQTLVSNGSHSGSQSTNLSISSLPVSPCPPPRRKRLPMLTGREQTMKSFRFPPTQPAPALDRMATSPYKQSFSSLNNFVKRRSLSGSESDATRELGGLSPSPRARARKSPKGSVTSTKSSSDPESPRRVLSPPVETGFSRKRRNGHSRQVSIVSSISQSVIVEDVECNDFEQSLPSQMVVDLQSEFGVPSDRDQTSTGQTHTAGLDLGASHRGTALKIDDTVDRLFDELHRIMDVEEVQVQKVLQNWSHFDSEAKDEIRQSRWKWPDTEWSKEAVAHFLIPTRVRDILVFILDSQTRFRSCLPPQSHASLLGSRSPSIFPAHAPSPPTPLVSDTSMQTEETIFNHFVSPTKFAKPSKPVNRRVLAAKSANLSQTASQATKGDGSSPFTALPPKLGLRSKLRSSTVASSAESIDATASRATVSPSKRKSGVDTAFLGDLGVSKRRKDQFDAARRKLDGVGSASEQQSEDDTIEFDKVKKSEATGTGSETFKKTPRVANARTKFKRRQALSMIR
ncbi:hypothetical protein ACM66B_002392 [Microbotryomycetes sp. NB124-2]